ncbi:MAG: Mov34/MPN/PAD-1 family protein [Candidatus Diapherotrites archaeon]
MALKIKRSLLEDLLQASRNSEPNEFFALLSVKEKKDVLEEFVVLPFRSGDSFTDIFSNNMGYDQKIKGSFHSHPSNSAKPSRADLRSFPNFGQIHLIACRPYTFQSVSVFDVFGNPIKAEVVA